MKSAGIREAKARLSELARAAAKSEVTILTHYGKTIAMISSIDQTTRQKEVLTQANSARLSSRSPISWIWVSRARSS
jgi:antitoxin (DNA-binding transcriptional repressor) of toxin-antitoxin stability system